MRTFNRTARMAGAAAAIAAVGSLTGAAAAEAEPQGAQQGFAYPELPVGYFYSTFDEGPNLTLLVGGTAEDFCDVVLSDEEIDDPFDAEPGSAPRRLFFRNGGVLDIKSNDQHQPIHLYVMPAGVDSPAWINGVCNVYDGGPDTVVQEPLASGTADLKERISVMADGDREVVDVFNSVNGTAVGSNGTHYKIRASADLVVIDESPVGEPSDFVKLRVTEIRR